MLQKLAMAEFIREPDVLPFRKIRFGLAVPTDPKSNPVNASISFAAKRGFEMTKFMMSSVSITVGFPNRSSSSWLEFPERKRANHFLTVIS